jgi:hypothetical protein
MFVRGGKPVYWGETPCEGVYGKTGAACKEKGRYLVLADKTVKCGIHAPKDKKQRQELAKNPKAEANRDALMASRAQAAHKAAKERKGSSGEVTAASFGGMMKEWSFEPLPGWLPIFPNNKHGHGFNYGIGASCSNVCVPDTVSKGDFSSLSPMKLGPVMHAQKDVPVATSIENYHQFNKVYEQELSATPCDCVRAQYEWPHFKPIPEFYVLRNNGYRDPKPHRRKFSLKEIKAGKKEPVKGNAFHKNAPVYSVHVDPDGTERHFTYVESRYFYCFQMERLATQTPAFARLQKYKTDGYNLQIVGYDAYTPDGVDPDTLYRHYCDPERPFGHEMVILALLAIASRDQYPWHRYHSDHARVYSGPASVQSAAKKAKQ